MCAWTWALTAFAVVMAAASNFPLSSGEDQLETIAGFLKPSMELLTYYRQKIVAFERERAEYLERLAVVERQNGDVHRLRWELRAREEEVRPIGCSGTEATV